MHIVVHAFLHTVSMLPFLFAAYVLVGFIEYRYENRLGIFVMRLGMLGPLVGALAGCIPQCGFSVVASTLYVKRFISTGTLLAVYLSTSDEAIPVLLSMPWQWHTAITLIVLKLAIAITAGIAIDLLAQGRTERSSSAANSETAYHQAVDHHPGCCAHEVAPGPSATKALFIHPLRHTLKIFLFLFILTAVLDAFIAAVGAHHIQSLFLHETIFQPAAAALVGLIPNCFSSVALVQLFDQGILDFGSLAGGLCAASGLGPLVLIKENKNIKNTLLILTLLFGISVLSGILIQISNMRI
jgi:hypothetical protein